uniref:Uncharacterized protein n=1 Tax=Panagrolaimus superbus TaxID=310955 RepID=A0A914YGA2_9BILA
MHHFCIRAIIYALFISFVLSAQSSNPSDKNNAPSLPVVEGSGAVPSKGNKNVVAADIDWEASGVGPDDEDGDVIEGSGGTAPSDSEVEGSGIPLSREHPPIRTTTLSSTTKTSSSPSSVTSRPPSTTSPIAIATTVITITTEDTKRQV